MVKYLLSVIVAAMALAGGIAKAETIQGYPQNAGMQGLVKIILQGDPIPRTGLLISPNLVLTSRWWLVASLVPQNVTVEHGHGSNRQPETKIATDIWRHPYEILALVRVSGGFSNAPAVSYAAARPAVGANLLCFGFSEGGNIKRAELRVVAHDISGPGYTAVSRARTDMVLNDGAGIPCFAEVNGNVINTLIGIANKTSGADIGNWKNHQISTAVFKDWVPNMIHLSRVRSTGALPMNLYTKPNPSNPNQRMCLHIPLTYSYLHPVDQQACNGSSNQLFYFHNFPDTRNPQVQHHTIVGQNNGMCLGISNTSLGVRVVQSPCDQGLNQDWEQSFYQPRPPDGIKLLQKRSNLCLSTPAMPSSASNRLEVEQTLCQNSATNFHQRWYIQWK